MPALRVQIPQVFELSFNLDFPIIPRAYEVEVYSLWIPSTVISLHLDFVADQSVETFGARSAHALAQRVPAGLRSLSLTFLHCALTDRAAQTLAGSFPAGLHSLRLLFNESKISYAGACAVAECVPAETSVLSLRFIDCNLIETKANALRSHLPQGCGQCLEIRNCGRARKMRDEEKRKYLDDELDAYFNR